MLRSHNNPLAALGWWLARVFTDSSRSAQSPHRKTKHRRVLRESGAQEKTTGSLGESGDSGTPQKETHRPAWKPQVETMG